MGRDIAAEQRGTGEDMQSAQQMAAYGPGPQRMGSFPGMIPGMYGAGPAVGYSGSGGYAGDPRYRESVFAAGMGGYSGEAPMGAYGMGRADYAPPRSGPGGYGGASAFIGSMQGIRPASEPTFVGPGTAYRAPAAYMQRPGAPGHAAGVPGGRGGVGAGAYGVGRGGVPGMVVGGPGEFAYAGADYGGRGMAMRGPDGSVLYPKGPGGPGGWGPAEGGMMPIQGRGDMRGRMINDAASAGAGARKRGQGGDLMDGNDWGPAPPTMGSPGGAGGNGMPGPNGSHGGGMIPMSPMAGGERGLSQEERPPSKGRAGNAHQGGVSGGPAMGAGGVGHAGGRASDSLGVSRGGSVEGKGRAKGKGARADEASAMLAAPGGKAPRGRSGVGGGAKGKGKGAAHERAADGGATAGTGGPKRGGKADGNKGGAQRGGGSEAHAPELELTPQGAAKFADSFMELGESGVSAAAVGMDGDNYGDEGMDGGEFMPQDDQLAMQDLMGTTQDPADPAAALFGEVQDGDSWY